MPATGATNVLVTDVSTQLRASFHGPLAAAGDAMAATIPPLTSTDPATRRVITDGALMDLRLSRFGVPRCRIVTARGLEIVSEDGALKDAVDDAVAANPDVAQKIRDGKVAARVRELILERSPEVRSRHSPHSR